MGNSDTSCTMSYYTGYGTYYLDNYLYFGNNIKIGDTANKWDNEENNFKEEKDEDNARAIW